MELQWNSTTGIPLTFSVGKSGYEQFSQKDPRAKYVVKKLDPRIHFALVCGAKVRQSISQDRQFPSFHRKILELNM